MARLIAVLFFLNLVCASSFGVSSPDGLQVGQILRGYSYGAIAYSPSHGQFGRSWNWSSRWEAEQVAMSYCYAFDCRPVVWVVNGCAALAVSQYDSYRYGYGWGSHYAIAVNDAMMGCYGPCYIKTTTCSY